MAESALFRGFDPYKLTGVRVTDRELGNGSYATVLELEYMGLKCAGKKIHEVLLKQGDASYTARRFEEECRLLSQVRHPNIVQFLGVYFQQGARAPLLVMEFLPTNLTSSIKQYGILPKEISYSILHDVALGLSYLHSQIPPIIHRDLSSNNVLLTPNMTAKISDLGVARILNLTPLQVSHMTVTPGTPAYMPPEVMVANPKYDATIDVFSYGILMIHMFSGRWPEPQVGQTRIEADRLIPVTEAERREVFLRSIENDHPLMDLIQKCINNDPQLRACTSDILECTSTLKPALYANQLEMMKKIDDLEKEKGQLMEQLQQRQDDIDRQNISHSSEIRKFQLHFDDERISIELQRDENAVKISELEEKDSLNEGEIASLIEKRKRSETQLLSVREQLQVKLENEREYFKEKTNLYQKISILEQTIDKCNDDARITYKTVESKQKVIDVKTKALEAKGAIISDMNKEITKAAEFITNKNQVGRVKVGSQYDASARHARDVMPKRKDKIDFYPCIADTALDASDFTWHKFVVEIFFAYKNHLTQSNAAACVHIVN